MKTTTQKLYDRLAKWNFKAVRDRVKKEQKVTEGEARSLQREYLRFMVLSTTLNSAPMFPAVDEFWHAHILHTEDYRAFCLELVGGFVDHRPNTGKEDPKATLKAYRAFRRAYKAEFGAINPNYWPTNGQGDCGASNCSGSSGCRPGQRVRASGCGGWNCTGTSDCTPRCRTTPTIPAMKGSGDTGGNCHHFPNREICHSSEERVEERFGIAS